VDCFQRPVSSQLSSCPPWAACTSSSGVFWESCMRTWSYTGARSSLEMLRRKKIEPLSLSFQRTWVSLGLLCIEQSSVCHRLISPSPLGLSCLPNRQLPGVECGIVNHEGWLACQPVWLEPGCERCLTATLCIVWGEHPNLLSLGRELPQNTRTLSTAWRLSSGFLYISFFMMTALESDGFQIFFSFFNL
jgi:hypothetical protein